LGGEVEDDLTTIDQGLNFTGGQVGRDHLEYCLIFQGGQVLAFETGSVVVAEAVDATYLIPSLHKGLCQVAADEAGDACDYG
jgi:hypothetical protein